MSPKHPVDPPACLPVTPWASSTPGEAGLAVSTGHRQQSASHALRSLLALLRLPFPLRLCLHLPQDRVGLSGSGAFDPLAAHLILPHPLIQPAALLLPLLVGMHVMHLRDPHILSWPVVEQRARGDHKL